MSSVFEHPSKSVSADIRRHLSAALNGEEAATQFDRDPDIRRLYRSLLTIEVRLGTADELPTDIECVRVLTHEIRGHLTARMIAEEVAIAAQLVGVKVA